MLNIADQALIQREAAMPGLPHLFDTTMLLELLQQQRPQLHARAATITYVRYKPGNNCLVGYSMDTSDGQRDIYAKAYTRTSAIKLYNRANGSDQTQAALQWVIEDLYIVFYEFPCDRKLPGPGLLHRSRSRRHILQKLLPPDLAELTFEAQTLHYKPERRYVAGLLHEGQPRIAIKCYNRNGFTQANHNSKYFRSQDSLRLPPRLGCSKHHHLIAYAWMPGENLGHLLGKDDTDRFLANLGHALGLLHRQQSIHLGAIARQDEVADIQALTAWMGIIHPSLQKDLQQVAQTFTDHLLSLAPGADAMHGDFYAGQVLIDQGRMTLLDLDRASYGDGARDLGNFLGHLQREMLQQRLAADHCQSHSAALLEGYAGEHRKPEQRCVQVYQAIALFRLLPECFRQRLPDWPEQMEQQLQRVREIIGSLGKAPVCAYPDSETGAESAIVDDAFGIARDPKLAFAATALEPKQAQRLLPAVVLRQMGSEATSVAIGKIEVVRHKPGRRCLLQYAFKWTEISGRVRQITLLGKINTRFLDKHSHDLLIQLRRRGFDDGSDDGISVPRPLGMIPSWHMFLMEKIDGKQATQLLAVAKDTRLVIRIADAIHKLHRTSIASIASRRQRTMQDELALLQQLITPLAKEQGQWAERLGHILEASEQLTQATAPQFFCGIHRDFYPDQVLVKDERLYLLDIDLYSQGEPVLDAGNFIAHLIEQGLRHYDDPEALRPQYLAFAQRFLALTGEQYAARLETYATLSLVRLIAISRRIPERRGYTEPLMDLCERRLGVKQSQFQQH